MDERKFEEMIESWASSKNLEWTSFRKDRVENIFRSSTDPEKIIDALKNEFKSFNVSYDDATMFRKKLKE